MDVITRPGAKQQHDTRNHATSVKFKEGSVSNRREPLHNQNHNET
jgi:hypothetical protein